MTATRVTSLVRPIERRAWTAHPAREHPPRTLLAVTVIAGLALLIARVGGDPGWGLASAGVLAAVLRRFFLPSRYLVTDDGVEVTTPLTRRSIRWQEVGRLDLGSHAALLARRPARPRFGPDPGLHVLLGADPATSSGWLGAAHAAVHARNTDSAAPSVDPPVAAAPCAGDPAR
ncbi:MAG: hypothetical protein KF817_06365 [Phycisphaeraceae bacterium]|nr:hypothetical protein [Phycisphaeraceae bacterium]